jgi:hypothetical protein
MKSTKSNYPKSRFARSGPDRVGKILKTVWSPESGHLRWSPQRGEYIDNDQALNEEELLAKRKQNYRDSLQPSESNADSKPSSSVSPSPAKQPSLHPSIGRYLETLKKAASGTDTQD